MVAFTILLMSNDDNIPDNEAPDSNGETKEETKLDRREFVKRCGKYSLYVAPVVAKLLDPAFVKAEPTFGFG